jgi:hypothetical protein
LRRIDTPTSLKIAAIGACGLWTVTRTGEQRLGGDRGGGLDQPEALAGEGAGRGIDDRRVGHGVGELVACAGAGKIDRELEVDDEALADLFLVRHHAMMGMDEKARHEDVVAHAMLLIAAMTRIA